MSGSKLSREASGSNLHAELLVGSLIRFNGVEFQGIEGNFDRTDLGSYSRGRIRKRELVSPQRGICYHIPMFDGLRKCIILHKHAIC